MTADQVLLGTVFQNDLRHGLDLLTEFRAQHGVQILPLGFVVMDDFGVGHLVFGQDFFATWTRLAAVRTPLIAAVAGYALGGGCELAMMCDVLIAADTAKFGQPEIKLGVLPGMGGSQRLTRAVGKAKAMDLILTGRTIDAEEADRSGLVSRVVPADELIREAKAVATTISQMSLSATRMAKEAVNRAFESSLAEGLLYERRLFHSAFATADQTEGMNAFSEKRPPNFTHS